jgi:putative glutamine amidotransferase
LPVGRVGGYRDPAIALQRPYLDAVVRAGGLAVVVAPDVDPVELLGSVDAVVLTGGPDVEPTRYGAQPHQSVYGVSSEADEFEIELVREAIRAAVPTLAICRGLQVLNVAYGGTLHQHIPDLEGLIAHGVPGGDGHGVVHDVMVEPGSMLADVCGAGPLQGSCHHHQAVAEVGSGLVVTARAADGVVEGLEVRGSPGWCVAVQWHPEDTAADDSTQQGLFDAVVREARARH